MSEYTVRRLPGAIWLLVTALVTFVPACGDDGDSEEPQGTAGAADGGDVAAGSTAIVAILNPVVNDPHTAEVPDELGTDRDGIDVDAEPGEAATTGNEGLAVVDVPVGAIDLHIGGAPDEPVLGHTVVAEGDVYDAAIAYDGTGAAFFPNTPIRYAVGEKSGAFFYDPEDDFSTINARLEEDDVVVVLRPGTYIGSLDIRGQGVLLFGEGWSDRAVVLDGDVVVNGGNVRLRGVTITGDLTSNGNGFGISFSLVKGVTDIKGNAGAFLRNIFCGHATVPSSNATLLDNYGIPPLTTLPEGACK